MHQQFLTTSQVAKFAKMSRQRLHVLINELRGPPESAYANNTPLYDAHVVAQWILIRNKHKLAAYETTPSDLRSQGEKCAITRLGRKQLYATDACKLELQKQRIKLMGYDFTTKQ